MEGPRQTLAKKRRKMMWFRPIPGEQNGEEVREETRCRGVGEWLGDLLNLFRCLGTSGNPICFGSLACTQTKKRDTSGCRVQIEDRKERNNETYVVQEGWGGLGQDMKHHNRAGEGG